MKVIGIIPARYSSKRFPGKLLADLNGKSVIQHTYEKAKLAKELDLLFVATNDEKIRKEVLKFGKIYRTNKCKSGTDRTAAAVRNLDCDIVINIQGDEPLLHPSMIDNLVKVMKEDKSLQVATIITAIKSIEEINNPNVVKVLIDDCDYAMTFSRDICAIYKHIGIYAYRKDFLLKLTKMPKSINEEYKSLEQMRILDNGYRIKCVETKYDTISVDTIEDLERIKNEKY